MLVVDGKPAISYYDSTGGALKYVRAVDSLGTTWGTPITVSTNAGEHLSMAIVDGNPAIVTCSYDGLFFPMVYVRANDAQGSSWGSPAVVKTTGSPYASLAVVNGRPAISYMGDDHLMYIRADDVQGSSWGTPVAVDSYDSSSVLYHTEMCLAVIDGCPAISYSFSDQCLKYVEAIDMNGEAWSAPVMVGGEGEVDDSPSMVDIDGCAAISYHSRSREDLKYVLSAPKEPRKTMLAAVDVTRNGNAGAYLSMVHNRNPMICFYDPGDKALKYTCSTGDEDQQWGRPMPIDDSADCGRYASLAILSNTIGISYYDYSNGDLRYARTVDPDGVLGFSAAVTVDTGGDVGLDTSLAVVAGNPGISYYDNSNGDLKYVRASDAKGDNWNTPVAVDTSGDVGLNTSLAVVDGNPAISYSDNVSFDLKFVRAGNAEGTSWGSPLTVDTNLGEMAGTSLAVIEGNPAISYYDKLHGNLKYVRAANAQGTSWGAPVVVDTNLNVGAYSTLAVVNGRPVIGYYDESNTAVKYVTAVDSAGAAWKEPVTIDHTGDVGRYLAMTVDDGHLCFSYVDDSNNNIKFMREGYAKIWIDWTAIEP
jgi:hypothetical protein